VNEEEDKNPLFGRPLVRGLMSSKLGESVTKGARLAGDRLEDGGIAASSFKSPIVTWSPPSIGFSGEVALSHKLGRLPKGILLVSQTFPFRWSVPAAQKAKWSTTAVYIWVPERHIWECGEQAYTSGNTYTTYTLERERPATCDVNAVVSQRDNSATDRPPHKHESNLTNTSGSHVDRIRMAFGDEASKGFNTQAHFVVTTNLHTSDEFSFLIV